MRQHLYHTELYSIQLNFMPLIGFCSKHAACTHSLMNIYMQDCGICLCKSLIDGINTQFAVLSCCAAADKLWSACSSIALPINAFASAVKQMTLQYIPVCQKSSTHIVVNLRTAKAGPHLMSYAGMYVPHSRGRHASS